MIGRQFEQACTQSGLTITKDPAAADIIFAHSGGCYLIPTQNRAQHIVLVGIAYWPGRPWLFATTIKVWREGRLYRQLGQSGKWAQKWLFHIRYANFLTGLRMARNRSFEKPWNSAQKQFIIRNQHDVYCCPDLVNAPFNGPRAFLSLPGEHDDCWQNPERYVDLLQSLHE